MPMRDAAPLVSLLGHELRAPAGVIGGYLTLIERALDRLTPEQQQAVAGARRAQHRLVEILDDASRLTAAWRADAPAPLALAADTLIADVRATAAAQGLALTASTNIEAPLRVTASRVAVAEALVAVAAAVAREHGADVTLTVASVPNGLVACHVHDRPGSNSVTMTNPGSGSTSPPAVIISGGGGSGATATANLSGGTVASITVTNAGSGYTSTPAVAIAAPPANYFITRFEPFEFSFGDHSPQCCNWCQRRVGRQ